MKIVARLLKLLAYLFNLSKQQNQIITKEMNKENLCVIERN